MVQDNSGRALFRFGGVPEIDSQLATLAGLAEVEDWQYKMTPDPEHERPILFNYIHYSFERAEQQGRIAYSPDDEHACWNTGLVTPNQEPLFMLFYANLKKDEEGRSPWFFKRFCRIGEWDLNHFNQLPEMPTYFEDPSVLVFDPRWELRPNINHIVQDNRSRFPDPFKTMSDYQLQIVLRGAIDNAKTRVQRNYKAAIPQYYRGNVQLLLPICLAQPGVADLALVVERADGFYRASTCLTLDMAYNNARQIAKPDRDWL